jgi:hypothetical protein
MFVAHPLKSNPDRIRSRDYRGGASSFATFPESSADAGSTLGRRRRSGCPAALPLLRWENRPSVVEGTPTAHGALLVQAL